MNNKYSMLFSDYTKNMYMSNKSSLWSKFNLIRINIVLKFLSKINTKWKDILEIWSYDLFFINYCLEKWLFKNANSIDLSDLYDVIEEKIVDYTSINLNTLKNNYTSINFKLITQYLEDVNLSKKYDYIFIFETLEHTKIESLCIDNLSKIIKKWWKIFVSIPVEHWLLFFIKDLWRKIILWNKAHSLKELFYWLIWRPDKIKRVIWGHKWYDYRKTKQMFIKKWFKLRNQKFYPFNFWFLWYWAVWEYVKL